MYVCVHARVRACVCVCVYARCFRTVQGRGRHRCSRTGPRPTAQQRNSFSHVYVCSRRFRLLHHLHCHQDACSIFLSDAPVAVALQDRTGQVCVCVCVCMCVCVCVHACVCRWCAFLCYVNTLIPKPRYRSSQATASD